LTLIKSISGIRGTIGGKAGEGLTPIDIVKFTSAFGTWVKTNSKNSKIVIGRDARVSGEMVNHLVIGTLQGLGFDIVDLGLSTTPTVEIAVTLENAGGGIIITASHNPKQWNALKMLNAQGEFISEADGKDILKLAESTSITFADSGKIGTYSKDDSYIQKHIEKILAIPFVDVDAIRKKKFKIVIDCVNSSGSICVPQLLKALGVDQIVELYCTPDGNFPHNPEPLPENLTMISNEVKLQRAHLGIVVDPDVDRLALVCEDGTMFGEEYTLVAVADYLLQNKKGNTVSNLSSTKALKDITESNGGKYFASAVGEVNVVKKMKEVNAVIGGEGNGGVIFPDLHYGRDALAGIALFLSHLAKCGKTSSVLRSTYPNYFMSKNRIELTPDIKIEKLFSKVKAKYKHATVNEEDGLRLDFDNYWIHLRSSNTEPIIRIYSESNHETTAKNITLQVLQDINYFVREGL